MNPISLILLALAMSTDAFAAAIGAAGKALAGACDRLDARGHVDQAHLMALRFKRRTGRPVRRSCGDLTSGGFLS